MKKFDAREAAVLAALDADTADVSTVWRDELPWHPGDGRLELHVAGFVRGEAGTEFFMARARPGFSQADGATAWVDWRGVP